jgi:hypothetical protein
MKDAQRGRQAGDWVCLTVAERCLIKQVSTNSTGSDISGKFPGLSDFLYE